MLFIKSDYPVQLNLFLLSILKPIRINNLFLICYYQRIPIESLNHINRSGNSIIDCQEP